MKRFLSVISAMLLVSCGGTTVDQQPEPVDEPATVRVQRGPITSVLVVPGVVTANPQFVIEAPTAGQLTWKEDLAPDMQVSEDLAMGTLNGEPITSPASGRIGELLVPDSTEVAARIPIATVSYQGFGVRTVVPVAEQYRLYDGTVAGRVNIEGGPAGVMCQPVPILDGAAEPGAGVTVECLLPPDAPVIAGLTAKVGLTTGSVDSALLLPVSAVAGRVGTGEVTRVAADGSHERVSVVLGITDGAHIEILDGLAEGDTVLAIAPTLS